MNKIINILFTLFRWVTFAIAILFALIAVVMFFNDKNATPGVVAGIFVSFLLCLPTLFWLKKRKKNSKNTQIQSLSSHRTTDSQQNITVSIEVHQNDIDQYRDDKRRISFIKEEIARSPYIKSGCEAIILLRIASLGAPIKEQFFSLEEKKSLGLNTRMKISKELYSCMTQKALDDYENPKYIVKMISNKATIRFYRHINFERMKKTTATHYIVQSPNAALDECEWCKSIDGRKFPIYQNYAEMVDKFCTCTPYCYGHASPYFPELDN